ncbi:MAG: hypothetical protein ABDH20_01055 [Thermus sp.]
MEVPSGSSATLPIRVYVRGDPGAYQVHLGAFAGAPEGGAVLWGGTLQVEGGRERDAAIPIRAGPGWSPGDYPSRVAATAPNRFGGPGSQPLTLGLRVG